MSLQFDTPEAHPRRRRSKHETPLQKITRLREEAEAQIERLIALVDEIDGDPDLEPSMGDSSRPGIVDEAEGLHDDFEPSLGAYERHPIEHDGASGSQLQWSAGNPNDMEGDRNEDDEDGRDDEPSLGAQGVIPGTIMVDGSALWPDQEQVTDSGMDQSTWAISSTDDVEGEFDGREPDDEGGDFEAVGEVELAPAPSKHYRRRLLARRRQKEREARTAIGNGAR